MVWYLNSLRNTGELLGRRCWVKDELWLRMIFVGLFLLKTEDTKLWWSRGLYRPQALQLKGVCVVLHIPSCSFSQPIYYRDCIWFYWYILVRVIRWFVCIQRNVIPCDSFYLKLFLSSHKKISEIFFIFHNDFDSKILSLAVVNIGASRQKSRWCR